MTNFLHNIDHHQTLMPNLRLGHAIFPLALLLGIWFSFSTPVIVIAEAASPSEPAAVAPVTHASEDATAEDDPDPNLVPLDTEDPTPDATSQLRTSTSLVPRAEDLLQLNPAENSPATARFADALNPPAELTQTQDILRNASDQTEYASYNVPIVMDPSVQAHIRYFNTAIHGRFEQWLFRLSRYRPLVETIFTEFQLPSDLVYLSLVESGFNPYAYSRAKATGPWQFMKGTAKVYGLRVDSYVDERRDPIKSTVAAARYLRDLYDLFGAWPLAMAAYNAGEGKVMRALHKARVESFSEISKTRLIRRETKEYVPRFMAATIIARNPDRYGFTQEAAEPHRFDEAIITRPLHFRAISNATGIPYEELRLLNPELRRDATPPGDETYHLKVPVGTKAKVEQLVDRIPTYKFPPLPAKAQLVNAGSSRWYKVRIGDTLGKVSKRFGVPIKTLRTKNSLSSPTIRPGDFLVISR
ncbi:MAG: transglycosylase SLT domain-containing protein [Nitrospiraceae bacterium]|nr:transglycosylase SLT domain-containing protein [Nitrospiraceae bacterium]